MMATATIGVVKYVIIDPLKESIDDLRKTFKEYADEQKAQGKNLVLVEASTKSAHKRIDSLEERLEHERR